MKYQKLLPQWLNTQFNSKTHLEDTPLLNQLYPQMRWVFRWSKYVLSNLKLRRQNIHQHTSSVRWLGRDVIVPVVKKDYPLFETNLFCDSLVYHDIGELIHFKEFGIHSFDTLARDKTDEKELLEYEKFMELISGLPPDEKGQAEISYMLQHALNPPSNFPKRARDIAKDLGRSYPIEAMLFKATEYFDYSLYAFEAYHLYEDHTILQEVFTRYGHALSEFARKVPGFNEIWTKENENFAKEFLRQHASA